MWVANQLHGAEPFLEKPVSQEFHSILWNPNVFFYRIRKSPPLLPVMSQINLVHTHFCPRRLILILPSHLPLCLPNELLHSGCPTETWYEFFFSLIHTTKPVNPECVQRQTEFNTVVWFQLILIWFTATTILCETTSRLLLLRDLFV